MRALCAAAAAATMLAALPASAEELVELPTRPGVTMPVLVTPPAGKPVASLVLYTGSPGLLYSRGGAGPPILNGKNFLIRVRREFAAAGFLVASVDVPSDHPEGIDRFRGTAEHAADAAALIAWLRRKAPVPVWLVGTSMGTISAANAAARLRSGGPDGIVLTSTIVGANRQTAAIDAIVDMEKIAVPTLVIHNKEDACPVCPFRLVPPLLERLTSAPRKELIAVTGGAPPQGNICGPMARHGYIGIEAEVVGDIVGWIKAGN